MVIMKMKTASFNENELQGLFKVSNLGYFQARNQLVDGLLNILPTAAKVPKQAFQTKVDC